MAHGSYTGISKEPEVLTRDMLSPYSFTELSLLFLEKQFFLRVPAAGTQVAVMLQKVKVSVAQSCLTLCDPMVCPWDSPGKNTGVGYCSLQGHLPDLAYCQGLDEKGQERNLLQPGHQCIWLVWTEMACQRILLQICPVCRLKLKETSESVYSNKPWIKL